MTELSRPATIEDVARAAGVSRAAVSKVLRDAYGVSDAMRARVTAAMSQLEYRPRVAARAMRGRSFTLGIEVPAIGNQFFTDVVRGVMTALDPTPYQVVIAPAETGSRQGLRAIEALIDRQADGVIAIAPRAERADLERLALRTPLIMFGRHDSSDAYDTVVGDDEWGTRAVMRHLLDRGHRRIVHLTLDESRADELSPHGIRLRTYLDVMRENGLEASARVIRSDEGQAAAERAFREGIEADAGVSAVFAAHDELALGAQRAIVDSGRAIAIAGYDDVTIASHPAISLTTVAQPGEAMGARAVELLLQRIEGRVEVRNEVFPPALMVRESTAAAAVG